MPTDLYDYSFVEKIAQVETYPDQFPRVIFTGEVSNVEAYMKASDVFVFPSKREGMGNVVAEAMAVGLPCILTPYDGLPDEFGKPGHEYLLVKPNSDALANKVIEVLENEKLKNEIGLAARKWTEEHLELDSSLDLYARFYKTLKDNNQRNIYV
jgi:glycosyltransferase involved in cell wall biosynthesis